MSSRSVLNAASASKALVDVGAEGDDEGGGDEVAGGGEDGDGGVELGEVGALAEEVGAPAVGGFESAGGSPVGGGVVSLTFILQEYPRGAGVGRQLAQQPHGFVGKLDPARRDERPHTGIVQMGGSDGPGSEAWR